MGKNDKTPLQPFTSREDIIWAAGLFEGEGWISIQGRTPSIGIQMCDKPILDRFRIYVGIGNIYSRKTKSTPEIKSRKPQWAWRASGFQRVQAILAYLWPWLGARRRARAKQVLEIAKQGRCRSGRPRGRKGEPLECGNVRKYWRGCRCAECRTANNIYSRGLNKTTRQYDSSFYL
jgi:hypothetical protein